MLNIPPMATVNGRILELFPSTLSVREERTLALWAFIVVVQYV